MLEPKINAELAARLVAEQFPQWADLAVAPVSLDGWDNATFRLGDEYSIRLPSHDAYVPQVEKEHAWLPILGRGLPLPIPQPAGRGRPTPEFRRPWSVYRWIDGEPATAERIADLCVFAAELANFLRALQGIDPRGGPQAGAHSFFRGGPLDTYDGEVREALVALADGIDTGVAAEVWETALSSSWPGRSVWVHGDVTASNILVAGGRIRAVIDFGCCAVGDPACDLVIAWTLLDGESRDVFRRTVGLDDATWARARGWALWKALITVLDDERRGARHHPGVGARRFGWSGTARDVLDRVLAP